MVFFVFIKEEQGSMKKNNWRNITGDIQFLLNYVTY